MAHRPLDVSGENAVSTERSSVHARLMSWSARTEFVSQRR